MTSSPIPPRARCSFPRSGRDLDEAVGCQRAGQINMGWGNRRCAGPSLFCVRMCMRADANLLPGGSTRISIIRGLLEPPLNPPLCFTPLSHHPRAAQPTIHLLILLSPQPPLPPSSFEPPPHPSILPSISLPLLCSISHPTAPFIPLTSSSYAYPYRCPLHCRHLAQHLGITSPCLGGLNFPHSLNVLPLLEKRPTSLKTRLGDKSRKCLREVF